MKRFFFILLTICLSFRFTVSAQDAQKPRIIVLTDSEIDDRCSMAHLLFCSNDVEIAALIQTNSCFQRHGWSSEHWLEKQIDHYAEVYPNLKVHSKDYPSPDYLRSRIFVGDEDPAHVCLDTPASATQIGAPSRINPREWAATPGSEAIVKILLDNDPRPVFIQAWGGGSTAAKALQVIKDNHPADYERAARKVVMYNIWYQDAAGNYIEQEHPLVTMLVSYHFHATWDYGAQNYTADFVKRWLHDSPSALARDYVQTNISEGDSPAFLYSLYNGLRSHEHPTYGGWGGQFYKVAGMANVYRDTDKGSYSRWTEYVLRDFQSRLVWAVTPRYEDANHAPVVTIREGLDKTVRSGERVTLTADVEDDGFQDLELQWQHRQYISEQKGVDKAKFFENTQKRPQKFETAWWQFYEAGTCHEHVDLQINPDNPNQVSFIVPEVTEQQTLHLVFQTTDNNKMGLTGFARVILTILPKETQKPRILISSDIGGTDADDNQSMLHLLMYSDLFDIEGLVSSPSFGDGSKEEILRMIDIYAKDFPVLQKHCSQLKTPEELRPLCKQGRRGLAPYAGYEKATEGSDWIIECARRQDSRPLYVLVWGTLEDVAQALHDAPDIAPHIRVYWIGGPNKKFGVNSYAYIAENFPDLWMIEDNASYRGLISNPKDTSRYHAGYYDACMKDAGNIGADFINYYKGVVKMGDTPSLLYMMHGNPDEPEGESWGGSFEKTNRSSRRILDLTQNPKLKTQNRTDTVPVYSVAELRFKAKKQKLAPGTPCFNLLIDKQNWQGYYLGKGEYCVRYSAKQVDTPSYEITSDNGAFVPIKGTLVVTNLWPGTPCETDYKLGNTWWTDRADAALFEGKWQGAATVSKYRQQMLDDWAERLGWLKE